MQPIVLFGIQFTLSLVAYALLAFWTVAPRLFKLSLRKLWCRCCGSTCFALLAGRSWLLVLLMRQCRCSFA